MNRTTLFLLVLSLAGCSEENAKPMPSMNQMIESPLHNNVISSFDSYPPKPVTNVDGDQSSERDRDQDAHPELCQS